MAMNARQSNTIEGLKTQHPWGKKWTIREMPERRGHNDIAVCVYNPLGHCWLLWTVIGPRGTLANNGRVVLLPESITIDLKKGDY